MDKRGMSTPKASDGSRTGNLLAGLGKFAIDSFTGKRDLMLNRQKQIDNKTMDLAFRGLDSELDMERIRQFGPLMAAQDITDIGPNTIRRQRKGNIPSQTPSTEGAQADTSKGAAADTAPKASKAGKKQGKKPLITTEDSGPKSSTSKMKSPEVKAPKASADTPSGRARAGSLKDTEAAVKSKKITQEEGTYISPAYAAKVGRAATAKSTVSMPKAKKSAPKKPGGNGNVSGYNGNKKGDM